MKNIEAWAPYLDDPLTLTAFIAMLGGIVLLGVLKLPGIGSKLVAAIAGVFILGALVALLLAMVKEYKSPKEPSATNPASTKSQTSEVSTENPTPINIQMVQGSHNVLINRAEKSK